MTTRNDGGPFFPTLHGYVDEHGSIKQKSNGISIRDWFAGQAMAGLLAGGGCVHPENLARVVYDYADAVLAAREKEGR